MLRVVYDDFYDRIAAACRPGRHHRDRRRHRQPEAAAPRRDRDRHPARAVARLRRRCAAASVRARHALQTSSWSTCCIISSFRSPSSARRRGCCSTAGACSWSSRRSPGAARCFIACCITSRFAPRADVLVEGSPRPGRDPYNLQPGHPHPSRHRERERFHRLCPQLRIARVEWFSFAAYPLSGGFQPWSLVTPTLARRLLAFERNFEPVLGRFMGFRMMLAVEKIDDART